MHILFDDAGKRRQTDSFARFEPRGNEHVLRFAAFHGDLAKRDLAVLVDHEKAVALDPEYVPALFNLGNLYLTLGRAEDSVPWLEKAISFDSAHKNTHVRLGEAYKILFNFARAADHYKLASAIDANDP